MEEKIFKTSKLKILKTGKFRKPKKEIIQTLEKKTV